MDGNMDFVKNLLNVNNGKRMNIDEDDEENKQNGENFIPDKEFLKFLEANKQNLDPSANAANLNFKSFIPEPGFVLKTKNSKNEKIFINICKSDSIGAPKDISEEELLKIIETQNQNDVENAAFSFRIPMSLGEPHNELDNNGNACIVYDVCINQDFFTKTQKISTFMGFFIAIAIEGLEEKYAISLERNYVMLKNKKFMGKLLEQHIRIKSKPIISEVTSPTTQSSNKNTATEPSKKETREIPKYKIMKIEDAGFLVAEIELPKLMSANSIMLDLGEDRILLTTRSNIYLLDIYLPININQDESGAEFDFKRKILTITMPILQ